MNRGAAALLLTLAAALAGCGALEPYPAPPRAAQPGAPPGTPTGPRVAICYNTFTTTLSQVQAEAQQECSPNTVAEPADTDWYLQTCPLLLPARATFVCAPAAK
jgi:hypothetical protein